MNELKYEFTDETTTLSNGTVLHRIRALKDFSEICKGDLGGWIESEKNLSQNDNAWVYDNAKVYGDAKVAGDAWVSGDAKVSGNAKVSGDAETKKATDVLTMSPIGSRNDTTTFYKATNNKIFVKCGCKNTDIDTWLKMVEATHGNNKHGQAYKLAAQIARLQIELTEEKTDE